MLFPSPHAPQVPGRSAPTPPTAYARTHARTCRLFLPLHALGTAHRHQTFSVDRLLSRGIHTLQIIVAEAPQQEGSYTRRLTPEATTLAVCTFLSHHVGLGRPINLCRQFSMHSHLTPMCVHNDRWRRSPRRRGLASDDGCVHIQQRSERERGATRNIAQFD